MQVEGRLNISKEGKMKANQLPDAFYGQWEMCSNVNFEGYMTALGINVWLRRIAVMLQLYKVIEQQGDLCIISTNSTFRNYIISFTVGQMFEEFTKGLDNRHLKSLVRWEGDKLVCEQIGEKKNRGWTHWMEDDKLHLELYCEGEVCHQVFTKRLNE